MPVKLHYNFKDVFRAARFGLSIKKIWIQFLSFLIGLFFYSLFSYIALLVSGYSFKEVWYKYKFLALACVEPLNLWGTVLHIIGSILFILVFFIFATATAKVHFEQLKGDEFFEIKEALKFALTKGKASFLTPLFLIILIILILIAGFIYGLIARIPVIGPLFFILFAIPAFFACLFLIYLFISFLVSLFLGYSIVGTTGGDTFDTLFEIFSTINEEPWRLVIYEILLLGTVFLAGSIFIWFVTKALWIAFTVLNIAWPLFDKVLTQAHYLLPSYSIWSPIYDYLDFFGASSIAFVPVKAPGGIGFFEALAGWFMGIMGYFVIFMVLSYFTSVFITGNNLIFITLYRKKDEIDLLKEEEEPESLVPEIEEEKEENKD